MSAGYTRNTKIRQIIQDIFNSVTAENEAKPDSTLDQAACQQLAETDETAVAINIKGFEKIYDWCEAHHIQVRHHTMVWHQQTPSWFFNKGYQNNGQQVSREIMIKRLNNFIRETIETLDERWPGLVYAIDIVNEAIEEVGQMRRGNWQNTIGDDYIYQAFLAADKYKMDYQEVNSAKPDTKSDFVTVYADGRLIFLDENGEPTYQPSAKDLGVDGGEIDWSKSQIRTFQYAPWNGKRHTYEADRCGIEKGSVFVVKSNGASCPETSQYVGFYVNEGFGKVIYNPFFLAGNSNEQGRALITLAEKEQKVLPTPNSPNPHSPLIAFLENKKQTVESNQTVYQIVQDEVKILDPYFKKGKFASQWGSIRSLAMITPDSQQLITAIDAFLSHGVAKDKWEEQNRKGRLDDFMANHEREDLQSIMINLASEMAKKCKAREEDK